MKLIIKGTNFSLTKEQKDLVQEKFLSVGKFHNKILEIRIEVEYDNKRSKGDVFRCEANVVIPGKLIRVEKNTNDFLKSVNKVKDHLKVVLSKERKKSITKERR